MLMPHFVEDDEKNYYSDMEREKKKQQPLTVAGKKNANGYSIGCY